MVMLSAGAAGAQVLYTNSMDSPNAGGTLRYGFDGIHNTNGQWSVTHLPTGGWQGSGAAQVTLNAGQAQYMLGWWTPGLNWTPAQGDGVFIRFRMRWPSGQPASTAVRVKFLLIGSVSDGTDATSRVITFLGTAGGGVCTLEQGTAFYGGGFQEHHRPSDYGINITGDRFNGNYVGLSMNRNIEGPGACAAPPIMMTSFNNSNRGTPGYNHAEFGTVSGNRADDGWYHIQIEAKSGSAGNAYFKQWANNNNYATPSSKQQPLRYAANNAAMGLSATGWGNGVSVGAYVDTPPGSNFSYILEDFQVGRSFDPNWYPGGGTTTPAPPAPPSQLRVIRSSAGLLGLATLGLGMSRRHIRRRNQCAPQPEQMV